MLELGMLSCQPVDIEHTTAGSGERVRGGGVRGARVDAPPLAVAPLRHEAQEPPRHALRRQVRPTHLIILVGLNN